GGGTPERVSVILQQFNGWVCHGRPKRIINTIKAVFAYLSYAGNPSADKRINIRIVICANLNGHLIRRFIRFDFQPSDVLITINSNIPMAIIQLEEIAVQLVISDFAG